MFRPASPPQRGRIIIVLSIVLRSPGLQKLGSVNGTCTPPLGNFADLRI